jgi:2'-5' RNA ligase
MRDKRLFVAIDLPEAVTDLLVAMDPHLPGMRWMRADQIHLTVSFLGNVDLIAEETLREKLAEIRFTAFFMPVIGVGMFPPKGKPNVIWAGVGNGHPQLFHVYKKVQEAALGAGLDPDLRRWTPHMTFARCRDVSAEAARAFLKEHADFDAGMVRVDSFALYSSVPGPLGSAYTRELEVTAA